MRRSDNRERHRSTPTRGASEEELGKDNNVYFDILYGSLRHCPHRPLPNGRA